VGVAEAGFTRRKPYGRTDYRWTTERVQLVVPLRAEDRIRSIVLDIAEAAPEGTALQLRADGKLLVDERIPPEGATIRRAFVPGKGIQRLELIIECDTFLRDDPDGGPPRPLGVALRGLTLASGEVPSQGE
jgi:hypothetical protein